MHNIGYACADELMKTKIQQHKAEQIEWRCRLCNAINLASNLRCSVCHQINKIYSISKPIVGTSDVNNKKRGNNGKRFEMPNPNTNKGLSTSHAISKGRDNDTNKRNNTISPKSNDNVKDSTWTCTYCQRSNWSNHSRCIRCDSPRDSTNRLDDMVQIVDLEWKCPKCTLMNTTTCCEACGYNSISNATTATSEGNPKMITKSINILIV